MRIFIDSILLTTFSVLLTGCVHGDTSNISPRKQTDSARFQSSTSWHDGSNGGIYGIGQGWSIELIPGKYEKRTVVTGIVGSPTAGPMGIPPPQEYMWEKDDSEYLNSDQDVKIEPIMITEYIIVPAIMEPMMDTVLLEEEKTEYYLTDAVYNSQGHLLSPKTVKPRHISAVFGEVERQVVKVPERLIERTYPLEMRKGYRPILKNPKATGQPIRTFPSSADVGQEIKEDRVIEVQPWRFSIKNPKGLIAHVFDNYEDLIGFVDSLK